MSHSQKPKPHRRVRIRNGIILVLAGIAVVAAVTVELSSGVRREAFRTLMRQTTDRVEVEFRNDLQKLFEPVEAYLRVTERWGEFGALDLSDHKSLNTRFVPILDEYPFIASTMIANEYGAEYLLLREDNGWLSRTTDARKNPGRVAWQRWTAGLEFVEEWPESVDYDPRKRPWYKAALKDTTAGTGDIQWTQPYAFFTTRQIGITLSKYWRTPGNESVLYVAGVDIPLEAILGFADRVVVADSGKTFLLARNGRVFAPGMADPGMAKTALADSILGTREPEGLEKEAVNAWKAAGEPIGAQSIVEAGGDRWWVDFRTVMLDSASPYIAVILPESEFLADVKGQQHRYALMLGGLLLLSAFVTFVLTRYAFKEQSREPVLDLSSEEALRKLIAGGEGDLLEFKSTIRWNLSADRPGKEVEMAWLKTLVAFLNTDGGVLVVGVNDDGEVTGIDADRFNNDDKFLLHFNNLFKDHIGLEARSSIDAAIRTVGDKRIFVVECHAAVEPVFLKYGKDEKFYIRVGPSSRQLPISEVVKRFRGKNG
jgi:hypothetical protein